MRKYRSSSILLAVTLLAAALFAEAQQPTKIYRIGYLTERTETSERDRYAAFKKGLQDLGYVEGKNLVIELRRGPVGQPEKIRALAADLVRINVDVIVASGGSTTRVAKEMTTTLPIVFTISADPVGAGLVANLASPGANVTGLSDLHSALVPKRLELLKEVAPTASRVGVLLNGNWATHSRQLKEVQAAAPAFGITILPLPITGRDDIDPAFAAMQKEGAQGLIVLGDPLTGSHRQTIADLAIKNQLPTVFTNPRSVAAGGLMSYGANIPDLWFRAATFVDKILKGRKPADLPVEQPMRFVFAINLKTAAQIGVTIPPNVLVRATRIIK